MRKSLTAGILGLFCFLFYSGPVCADMPDSFDAMKIISGQSADIDASDDVSGDGKIGLPEAIYPLQVMSDQRPQFNDTIAMTTQYIEQEMARHSVTGLSIALVNNNGIIWEKGFGWADKENQVPAGPESVYMIGSVSKFFTAVVLARLQEQGMLNIDNPVSFYLPEFQMQDRYPGTFDQITLRSLLTHQSGIPGDLYNAGFGFGRGWDDWGGCSQYMGWLLDYLKEDYPTLPPGKHMVYSNTGFVLAGEIALRTAGLIGEDFPDFMDRMILSPLGMTSSSLHTVESNLARGYVCGATPETCEKQPVKETNCTFGATGGIYSSVRDMAAFMTTLLNQGTGPDGTRYLKPETIAMLGESESSNLDVDSFFITGLGLDTVKDPGLTYAGRAWGKTGGTGDYVSYMLLLPDVNLGVVVLTNSNTGGNLTFGASRTCLENALFESYGMLPSPPFLPDYPSVSDPGAIAGIYVKKNGFDRVQDKGDGTFNWIVNAHSEAPLTYTLTYDFDKKAFLSSRGNESISFTTLSHEGEDHFVMIQSGSSESSEDKHQYWGNVRILIGEKLTSQSIPDAWKNRMGLYLIDNLPWNDVAWEAPFALLSEEQGLMVMNAANTLVPETESLAYVAGLKNRADSSVRAILHEGKEKLMYGGYRFISPADIQAVTSGETLTGTVDIFKSDWYRFDSPGPGQSVSVTVSNGDSYYLTLVDMITEQIIRDIGTLSWVTSGKGAYYFSISPTPDADPNYTLWYLADDEIDTPPLPDNGPGIPQSGCGAFVAPGVWKEFDCYNLAAVGKTTNDDPFTPSWRLIGGYWHWGNKGPDSSQWYDTNTEHFAHGPTGPGGYEANDGSISNWDQSYASDGAWSDNTKTFNDPCPAGFRVPTQTQWSGVLNNNTQSTVGSWASTWDDHTNYSSGQFFGSYLLLPAAGYRYNLSGTLGNRGGNGYYWSSSGYGRYYAWRLYFLNSHANTYYFNRRYGHSVRCVAE